MLELSQGTGRKIPPIYYFYEKVDADEDGKKEDGVKYYRCNHGNKKILKITPKMNSSQNGVFLLLYSDFELAYMSHLGLISHIRRKFPSLFEVYEAINSRNNKEPKPEELRIAMNQVDSQTASEYLVTLRQKAAPLVEAFRRQAIKNEDVCNSLTFQVLYLWWD